MQTTSDNAATTPPACHTLPHFPVTNLLGHRYDIRTVQELLRNKNINMTINYSVFSMVIDSDNEV